MGQYLIPIALAIAGFITAFVSYRGIRRGGARYYTLEREAMLRRASITLFVSVVFFVAAIGVLIYQQQQAQPAFNGDQAGDEEGSINVTVTPTAFVEQFPPTITPTSDEPVETETPTPVICRAVVEGTSGNGLTLRESPGGAEVSVLPDGSVLTVLEDATVESGGFNWRKVRMVGGDEGWVAGEFLTIRAPCE